MYNSVMLSDDEIKVLTSIDEILHDRKHRKVVLPLDKISSILEDDYNIRITPDQISIIQNKIDIMSNLVCTKSKFSNLLPNIFLYFILAIVMTEGFIILSMLYREPFNRLLGMFSNFLNHL